MTVRVLHVLNRLEHSGAEIMLAVAADLWHEDAVEAEIAAKATEPGRYAEELQRRGYVVTTLEPQPSATLPLRLAALVRRHGVDVVHVHTEHANFWLALAARATGARVVRTVHAQFNFTGALRAERRVQRRLLRALHVTTVAVSRTVADHEKRRFGNPMTVIPNWIDTEVFHPADDVAREAARETLGIAPNAVALISVGNCHPVKRHDLILELVHRLPQAIYLHVGAEDPAASDRTLAASLGIDSRVRFVGPTEDVRRYLLAADVFIAASDREGSSVSTSEALACGVPCLLRDLPVLREVADAAAARFFRTVDDAERILASLDRTELTRWRTESEQSSTQVREERKPKRGVDSYAGRLPRRPVDTAGHRLHLLADESRHPGTPTMALEEPRLCPPGQTFRLLARTPNRDTSRRQIIRLGNGAHPHSATGLAHGHARRNGTVAIVIIGVRMRKEVVDGADPLSSPGRDQHHVSVEGVHRYQVRMFADKDQTLRMPAGSSASASVRHLPGARVTGGPGDDPGALPICVEQTSNRVIVKDHIVVQPQQEVGLRSPGLAFGNSHPSRPEETAVPLDDSSP